MPKDFKSPFKDAIVPTAGKEMKPTLGTNPAGQQGDTLGSSSGKINITKLPSSLSDILGRSARQ